MQSRTLNEQDRARIAAAVRDAETKTAAEIYCVLARSSDDYRWPALALAALMALGAALFAVLTLPALWPGLGWSMTPLMVLIAQALFFLALAVLLRFCEPLRLMLLPDALKGRATRARALDLFLAHGLHKTSGRTGILLYVSLAERRAEIVADALLDAALDDAVFLQAVDALIGAARRGAVADGFMAAISGLTGPLAEAAPWTPADENELPDHLVEL